MKVVVTGGCGYVGCVLLDRLVVFVRELDPRAPKGGHLPVVRIVHEDVCGLERESHSLSTWNVTIQARIK